MTKSLLVATRSSELALRQARLVQSAFARAGVVTELKTYKTLGDKKLDEPLNAIGGKGLFTKELEVDLARGAVDCCVHSLKDLQTDMPDGLAIGAIIGREEPRDGLIVNSVTGATSLDDLPRGSRVGTSSLRRRAQLLALRSDVEVVALRGNVPTRIRKVDEGQVHAAILAAAGVHRLGVSERIASYLDAPAWLPAAGARAVAGEVSADERPTPRVVAPVASAATRARACSRR